MTVTQAAKVWLETKRKLRPLEKQNKAAAEVLKEYFRTSGNRRFRGVVYALSTYTTLDLDKARAELGPTKTKACEVTRTRETLSPVEQLSDAG